jgi:hypothetical protein
MTCIVLAKKGAKHNTGSLNPKSLFHVSDTRVKPIISYSHPLPSMLWQPIRVAATPPLQPSYQVSLLTTSRLRSSNSPNQRLLKFMVEFWLLRILLARLPLVRLSRSEDDLLSLWLCLDEGNLGYSYKEEAIPASSSPVTCHPSTSNRRHCVMILIPLDLAQPGPALHVALGLFPPWLTLSFRIPNPHNDARH